MSELANLLLLVPILCRDLTSKPQPVSDSLLKHCLFRTSTLAKEETQYQVGRTMLLTKGCMLMLLHVL